jgi:hypothetical protein
MSMTLWYKMVSMPYTQIVPELNSILDNANVRITWGGKRVVSVKGYKGEIEINDIAMVYLSTTPFIMASSTSLKNKQAFGHLGFRVVDLYKDSDKKLSNTMVYKYLVPVLELNPFRLSKENLEKSLMP